MWDTELLKYGILIAPQDAVKFIDERFSII